MDLLVEEDGAGWRLTITGTAGMLAAEKLAENLAAKVNSMRCSRADDGAISMPSGFDVTIPEA